MSKELEGIFGTLASILAANLEIFRGLQQRLREWNDIDSRIGDVFVHIAPVLVIYVQVYIYMCVTFDLTQSRMCGNNVDNFGSS